MSQLDRYLFSQSIKPLMLITICVTAIVWLTQILQRVDLMVEDGGTLSAFLKVTVLIIPNLLAVVTPFTLFATALFILNRLKGDSEIAVMSASGASTFRVARPLLALALLGTVLSFYLNLDLMPRSYRVLKDTVQTVRSDIAKSLIRAGEFTTVVDGLMVYAEEVRPGGQYLGMLIYDERNPTRPTTYMAEAGLYRNTVFGPRLHLARGNFQQPGNDGKVNVTGFTETAVDLTQYQRSAGPGYREPTERYISELLYPDMSVPYDIQQEGVLKAEGHARLSNPFYNILFVLIAMLALIKGPFNRNGYSRRILYASGIAIFLRVIGFTLENAAASTPAMNIVQYILPIGGSIVCLAILVGLPRLGLRRSRRDLTNKLYPRRAH
ncbi:LptF/LptG family permease [Aquisalinus flavus]|uniref:Lipopolysaccharide export system permease protein LptF n=1 Tax=Aquisalinus flavus TaxID=1526572 RepID=A0A8J2V5Q2_9PROT|nr:LptF/LptG family permease [Aquisalinus flavus]MBD0427911.1 LptF/LptG family permease [Aquisalinus flavus]UNE47670.1 LptF/LptG family permease [Aquisalinus flavus]GGD04862.1 hypothetical protein GCM10011342_12280 [Aquisalinus flavus]